MQSANSFAQHLHHSLTHKQVYDEWAATHDREVAAVHYQAPYYVAMQSLKVCPKGTFLDLGCGTGLVGEAIQSNCSEPVIIDGCDASREMLKIASAKNIYRSLTCCDILEMPFPDDSYDLVTAAGVFASSEDRRIAGDPDCQAVPDIARLIKPGGYFVFSVSCRVWETDYQGYNAAIANSPFKQVSCIEKPYHTVIPTAMYFVLQKQS